MSQNNINNSQNGVTGSFALKFFTCLLFWAALTATAQIHAAPFTDTFDDNFGDWRTNLTSSLAGVNFVYTFTNEGDGGDFKWDDAWGVSDSSSIILRSSVFDTNTTELFTIARQDGLPFTFTSIFVNNSGGDTVTVEGYRNGNPVGSPQTMSYGASGTLSFGNIAVDEVRISSRDFLNTNLDSFSGDTDLPNTAPTDINLSSTSVNQSGGTNAAVGTLSTVDSDSGDSHTYALVAGTGDTNNASFNINDNQLRANNASALSAGDYSVRIQTNDGTASFSKSFNITVVDDIAPVVGSVAVPADGTYLVGQNLDFTVNLSENVTVTGTPRLALTIGTDTRHASYVSGSGSAALLFRYTVQSGDMDTDGIAITTLELNGGTIRDTATNNLITTLNSVGDTSAVLVDTAPPTVTAGNISISGATGTGGTYRIGDTVTATWNNTAGGDNNSVAVTSVTVNFTQFGGGGAIAASNSAGTWVASHTIVAGSIEATNRNVSVSASNANGSTTVSGDNNATVDNVPPSGHSVSFESGTFNTADATSVSFSFVGAEVGAEYSYTINSSGGGTSVTGTGTIAAATDQISGIDVSGLNDGTLTLSVILADSAGNVAGAVTDTATLDGSAPVVNSVSVPANGTYGAGQNLDFTVNANENVTVNTTDGTPQIALTIGASTRQAVYLSGSGTSALVFRYTVQTGDVDNNGIAVAATIDANGATLQDDAGNNMALTLNSVGTTAAVLIDTDMPVNSLPVAQSTNTITPLVFSSGNGNALSVSDNGNLTVVMSIGSGTLNASTGGSAVISNNGTGTVTIAGAAAEVNVALEGLTYTPNGAGVQTLNMQAIDGAGNSDEDDLEITVNNSTLLVTSSLDTGDDASTASSFAADQADGDGLSIREALHWAHEGDTITFDFDSGTSGNQGGTITLNGGQLTIAHNNIRIDGDLNDDGSADVTISGNNISRVMTVNSGLTGIELTGLTLTQGAGVGGPGLSLGINVSLTLRNSNVTNNTESGLGGGGIYGASVTLTIINSTISGNSSDSFGGGIRVVGAGSVLNVINSTVSGNTTTGAGAHGGGIQYAGSTLTIVNTTISGNSVTGVMSDGGGLRITTGTSYIYNSTIVGNAAVGTGGGVSANGTSDNFINTVVAGNTAGAGATAATGGSPLATGGAANDVSGTVEVATHSYFGTSTTITTDNNSLNNQGTLDLLLGNLTNFNGSPVQTHRPLAGSALLEAGSNAALPSDTYDLNGNSDTAEPLPVDANGLARVSGIVDIGAVEGTPAMSSINVPANGTYIAGDHLDFTINTPVNITVTTAGGTPRIALTVGSVTRYATYLSGSGTSAIVFRHTVQAGDSDSDGITVDALELNGGTLRDGFDRDLNTTLYSVGDTSSVLVDAVAPTVSSVLVPSNGTYVAGENLDFTVNTDKNVTVDTAGGTPQIALTIGADTRQAVYVGGSGTSALAFRYTVQAGDVDSDGITVAANLDANGGTVRDSAGNNLDTALQAVAGTSAVLVDAEAPSVSSVDVPSNRNYVTGENLDFTVNTDESVIVDTTGGTPQIALTIGADTRQAVYVGGSGTSALAFRYTVQSGDVDSDGITVAANLDANGGTLRDSAGNDLDTTLNSVASTASILVNAAPDPVVVDSNTPVNVTGDLTITANGVVTGGTFGGGIVTNLGTITGEVTLLSNTTINGGIISGTVTGNTGSPAQINGATITAGAVLSNVVISADTVLEPGVQLGPNVKFRSDSVIPPNTDLTGALRSITWLVGDERRVVDLTDDVLVDGGNPPRLSLMMAVRQLSELADLEVAQVQNGQIEVVTGESISIVLPISVSMADPDTPEGIYMNDEGDVVIVTSNRRVVVAYPVLADQAAFLTALQSLGLQSQYDDRANLRVDPIGSQSATISDSGVMQMALTVSQYYSARPQVTALPAHRGTQAGLLEYPIPGLGSAVGLSLLFEPGDGGLLEQDIVPVPANLAELREAIALIGGVSSVRIDFDGVLVATTTDGAAIRARADYVVYRGAEPLRETLTLQSMGDVTGNGTEDYEIIYTNGDRQLLFIYPDE